jgi:hypothetical protein
MLKPARTVGAAATQPAPVAKGVTTATLIRGRVYFWKNLQFNYGLPVKVDEETGIALEEIHEEVPDGEGEVFEKAFFHVKRNQPEPSKAPLDGSKKPMRRLPIVPLSR